MRDIESGETKELLLSFSQFDECKLGDGDLFEVDGRVYEHLLIEDHRGGHGIGTPPANWPQLSWGLGISPRQREAYQAHLASKGVHLDMTAQGRAIIRSAGHRRAVMEATGTFDRDAGYGDATPRNF